ncbi:MULTISPECIES: MarR family winged helix-turn-helix transcriptional regulator [unclassified Plantibacter]|jgi:DNA-binding MarR family transcriptional regulator|uniref:MarR family winged helix-turn-helix transcriptional regulator n=1 Tax=unclassified Plantibacter TaxID=2624265 RepID=UPI003D351CD4
MDERRLAVTAWEALFRAQVDVMRHLSHDFPSHGISLNEYDVLLTMSREPDRRVRLRDLNTQVLLSQPSISRLVDRLVARGLVGKCPDPDDGRGTFVRMTDAGYDVFRKVALEHGAAIAERVTTSLNPDEMSALAALSNKLRGS